MRVPLGRLVATPAALALLRKHGMDVFVPVQRHQTGDWGDVDKSDAQANEDAMRHGNRLLSVYKLGDEKIWIITEADRSSTCVMTPQDY